MAIWARSSSTSEKPDSTSLAEAALLCVLADLATSQPRTEATGRSAGGMLPPVPPVPMVLQVCFRSPDWGTGFSNSLAAALPCSKSAPVCGYALENTPKHFKHFIIYILWICWCVAACISHSRVNGKFPDGLTSVLPHLFSIPLSSPPPFVSSVVWHPSLCQAAKELKILHATDCLEGFSSFFMAECL